MTFIPKRIAVTDGVDELQLFKHADALTNASVGVLAVGRNSGDQAIHLPIHTGSNVGASIPIHDNGNVISVDDGGSSLTVDGTVGVSGSVTVTGSVNVTNDLTRQVGRVVLVNAGNTALESAPDFSTHNGLVVLSVEDSANNIGAMRGDSLGRIFVTPVIPGTDTPVILEDDASHPGKFGLPVMGITAVGDKSLMRTDADGHVQVDVLSAPAITGTVTVGAITAGTTRIGKIIITDDTDDLTVQKIGTAHGISDTGILAMGSTAPTGGGNPLPFRVDASGELQVDVNALPSIPAGSNNIGGVNVLSLPALPAGANNIGDVDVLSLPALPAGTNNIGDVDVASIAAGTNYIGKVRLYDGTRDSLIETTGALDVILKDGSGVLELAKTGTAHSAYPVSILMLGSDYAASPIPRLLKTDVSGRVVTIPGALTHKAISVATSGNTTLQASVASNKVKVISYVFVSAGTVNVKFVDGGGGGDLTGAIPLVANSGVSFAGSVPCMETGVGAGLQINLSANVQVSGHITYIVEP